MIYNHAYQCQELFDLFFQIFLFHTQLAVADAHYRYF